MRSNGRQFRVFVSSTFSDFKHEREALQERVFPKLHAYCESQGARFQPIDLRWGISEDAARDHQTVRICLEEIRRSQRLSPRPNFIVLLGDRYGWRPIPDEIPAEELELLREHFTAEEQTLIDRWYGRDDNAVPPIYYLRPRPAEMDDAGWEEAQAHLANELRRAVTSASLSESERLKYFASATHLEVSEGLLNVPDAEQHVFAYCRQIDGLPEDPAIAEAADFVDVQDGVEAITAQSDLKALIRAQLPDHTRDYRSRWMVSDISRDHIDALCADVEADLKAVIDDELEQLEVIDPVEWEAEQHRTFAAERARIFVGRQTELARIADYLASDNTTPLVVHGPGGVGKSALVARVVEEIDADGTVIIQRFIGATPESSQLRTLLTSLYRELGRRYGTNETVQYEKLDELIALFESRLELATAEHPLVLIIDSLDQLDHADMAHQLQWLPSQLPTTVKVIASTRQSRADGKPLPVYQAAERQYRQDLLALGSLKRDEGDQALDALLGKEQTVTPNQRAAVLDAFTVTGLPLFLKLAVEQARQWRSDTPTPELPSEAPALIRAFIAHLQAPANHGPVFVERTLAYLQAGRYGGLAEDELAHALALDPDVMSEFRSRALQPWNRTELPPILWARLHGDLEPYLTKQDVEGALVYRFFHREFAEVVEEDALVGESGQARHATLAQIYAWHSDPAAFRKANETSVLRQIMELPYQLQNADRLNDLKVLLTDFTFAYTKCAANRSDDLVNNYLGMDKPQTLSYPDLRVWIQFMHSSSHLLRRGTTQWPAHKILLQLAIEHAENSFVTLAAESWLESENCDWFWFHTMRRPQQQSMEHCIAVMEGHRSDVIDAEVLPDDRLLSYSEDGTLRMWSSKGIPLAILRGHTDGILGIKLLPDSRILSWSGDGTLRLWSPEGAPIGILAGHTGVISGASILPDSCFLSWSEEEGTLRYWSSEGNLLATLEGHTDGIFGVKVLPDGCILSWSLDQTLRLWSSMGKPLAILKGHTASAGYLSGPTVLSQGCFLTWSYDGTLQLWSSEGNLLATLEGHTKTIQGVKVLSDGSILSWSSDRTLRLWSSMGKPLATLEGHKKSVLGVETLSDGRLLSWSGDRTLRLWSPEGAPLCMLGVPMATLEWSTYRHYIHSDLLGAKALSTSRLLSWFVDGSIQLWSTEGAHLATLKGHSASAGALSGPTVLSQGRFLTWSCNGTLRLRSSEGNLLATLEGHTNDILGVKVLPGDRILSWSRDGTLRLWLLEGDPHIVLKDYTNLVKVNGAEVLTDGRLLSWSGDGTLQLWSSKGNLLATLKGHTKSVWNAKALSDGRLLSWSNDRNVRLWSAKGAPLAVLEGQSPLIRGAEALFDCRILSWSHGSLQLWSPDGTVLATLEGHTAQIEGVEVLPDGRLLSWSLDGTLRLWSSQGTSLATLKGHTNLVNGAEVLPDGRFLSWSGDWTLRLWSTEGAPLMALVGHTDSVLGAKVLSDGRLFSWSWDGTLRLWSSEGVPLAILQGCTDWILGAEELSDGRLLSWSRDGMLQLWSSKGNLLATLKGHTSQIEGVEVLPDNRLLSWSLDGTLRLWDVPVEQYADYEEIAPGLSVVVAMSYVPYQFPNMTEHTDITFDRTSRFWVLRRGSPMLLQLYAGWEPVISFEQLNT